MAVLRLPGSAIRSLRSPGASPRRFFGVLTTFLAPKPVLHPQTPARTRFAPSPTGSLHLGSLRTALYNYLLARNTGGQFLLRLEDTDQKRLIPGSENSIYEALKWCGLKVDEGPNEGGPYGPYRQSDRKEIYRKFAMQLVENGNAYYCGCSKDRLDDLRQSAMKLKPPTTVTYDRKCLKNDHIGHENDIIRFKSPDSYEPFEDLLHGKKNIQPQTNARDRRYDDFVIMKSDGLPTYHFASVVDDHLMKITHVIRGEEWLSSTPKHVALYRAFGWDPPKYIHIPLLTSMAEKKLSKRAGDSGILEVREQGILPEALTNFCALFGWSPPRDNPGESVSEIMPLKELEQRFSLDHLTKGNAKVNIQKLHFFNKHFLQQRIGNAEMLEELVDLYFETFTRFTKGKYDKEYLRRVIVAAGPSIRTLNELEEHSYLFDDVAVSIDHEKLPAQTKEVLSKLLQLPISPETFSDQINHLAETIPDAKKTDVFRAIRMPLSGKLSGLNLSAIVSLIGPEEARRRIAEFLKLL